MSENDKGDGALVRVDGVGKVFHRGAEDIHALANLSLRVSAGEFLALMGPSGSGKSTLLNLIGGLDRPTKGSVFVGRERIDQLSDLKLAHWRARHVGFVFQLYNLMPVLSAEQNVELPLLLTHLSKAERKKHVETALAVVGLSHRAKHYPRTLSGGEQQRVGIARAVVTDPTLLLCDEPTGDLGRKAGNEILDLLQALNREHGKTIIMGLGATFSAMNTVYSLLGSRGPEIGILHALGFTRRSICFAFMLEALLIALAGGLLGCLLCLPLHDLATGTFNWRSFSEVAFEFRITGGLLAGGMVFAAVMGLLGGLLPALLAARRPALEALAG